MKKQIIGITGALVAGTMMTVSAAGMMATTDMSMKSKVGMRSASFMSSLMVGSSGDDVMDLQTFLEENGYLVMPEGASKGYFGGLTKKALMRYQMSVGLPGTGYFGTMTRAKINDGMMMSSNTMMKDAAKTTSGMSVNTETKMNSDSTMMKDSGGVMVGGSLMIRTRDIVDNAVLANNVTTVVAAVKAAGLVDTLKSAGPFTVFAPNNAAFTALPAGTVETLLMPENKAKLVDILTYHVVSGKYKLADLYDGEMLTTVEGKKLMITKVNGRIMINGSAMIETPDVISSNGVTHVITSVLLPQ